MSIDEQKFESKYDVVPASVELANIFKVASTTPLLRRRYTSNDPRSGNLLSASVSYIPKALVEANPAILDEHNEPRPGRTLHQLSTVGIEIMKVVDGCAHRNIRRMVPGGPNRTPLRHATQAMARSLKGQTELM